MRAWYRHSRFSILFMLGAAILGPVFIFYLSALYSYQPMTYNPFEESREIQLLQREIQLEQKELEELQWTHSEQDRLSMIRWRADHRWLH